MDYLKKVLGIEVVYENVSFKHLPNFIISRYKLKMVVMDGKRVVFLYPVSETERVDMLKKHIARIQKIEGLPVVFVTRKMTSYQKEDLIRAKIPFIVDGKQIYLPFMAIYLQEKCDAEKQPESDILPSAQMLLLYFIYCGAKEMTTSQAAKDLSLTPTSVSRASRQLEDMELIETKKVGVHKILFSDHSPRELFKNAEQKLVDPVKRTVYIPESYVTGKLIESNYMALAEYSMLNVPDIRYYASEKVSQWNDVMSNKLYDPSSQVAVEMWRYDPGKLSHKNIVDELSLALTLRKDHDERVEEAVEEMLENLWRKIDGNGN